DAPLSIKFIRKASGKRTDQTREYRGGRPQPNDRPKRCNILNVNADSCLWQPQIMAGEKAIDDRCNHHSDERGNSIIFKEEQTDEENTNSRPGYRVRESFWPERLVSLLRGMHVM